jgi:hypothetical protein
MPPAFTSPVNYSRSVLAGNLARELGRRDIPHRADRDRLSPEVMWGDDERVWCDYSRVLAIADDLTADWFSSCELGANAT